jgi:hypothetical protein
MQVLEERDMRISSDLRSVADRQIVSNRIGLGRWEKLSQTVSACLHTRIPETSITVLQD